MTLVADKSGCVGISIIYFFKISYVLYKWRWDCTEMTTFPMKISELSTYTGELRACNKISDWQSHVSRALRKTLITTHIVLCNPNLKCVLQHNENMDNVINMRKNTGMPKVVYCIYYASIAWTEKSLLHRIYIWLVMWDKNYDV